MGAHGCRLRLSAWFQRLVFFEDRSLPVRPFTRGLVRVKLWPLRHGAGGVHADSAPTATGRWTHAVCSAASFRWDWPDSSSDFSIPGQLNTTLRADNAHAGDVVRFKTIEPVLVSKGLIIPQNTQLLGHVLGAAPKQGQAPSWISVVVDPRRMEGTHFSTLHAFLFGQILASPGPQTGEADGLSISSLRSNVSKPQQRPRGKSPQPCRPQKRHSHITCPK